MDDIILVDTHDRQIGTGQKLPVHIQGALHRAFSVFVVRQVGEGIELLLQRRAMVKYHSAGLWSNTTCGHPKPGQEVLPAAIQRLYEEMGIRLGTLTKLGVFTYRAQLEKGLWEHEVDHVFLGWDDGQEFVVNPDEVMEWRWAAIGDLQEEMRQMPQVFTAWFAQALEFVLAHLG